MQDQLTIDVNLNNSLTSKPLLRLYEKEPRSLGIYVYHEYKQLK